MASIVVGVEANQVAVKETGEQSLSHRQNSIDFTAGERRVQEEANLDILLGVSKLFSQHLRQKHQVVVVDPNKVAVLHILDDCLGEEAVDLLICAPRRLVKGNLAGVVVEERPQDRVCKEKNHDVNIIYFVIKRTGL
jgi:hypothetical protein